MQWSSIRFASVSTLLVAFIAVNATASAAGATWRAQITNTTNQLHAISCAPKTRFCVAVGENAQIVSTTTGGQTWTPHPNPFADGSVYERTNVHRRGRRGRCCDN